MLRLSYVVILLSLLSGCVSEQYYSASASSSTVRHTDSNAAARTRIALGLSYLQRGDTVQAIYNLEKARQQAPLMPEVYNALAWYSEQTGDLRQAESFYRQALQLAPEYPDANHNYATYLCRHGQSEAAEYRFRLALAAPGYLKAAETYENMAQCLLQQQKFTEARTSLLNALAHNSKLESARLHLAVVDYAMGNYATASASVQQLSAYSARRLLLSYLVAERLQLPEQHQIAEQLLNGFADSNEAGLLRQQQLQLSEFELLRQQFLQQSAL